MIKAVFFKYKHIAVLLVILLAFSSVISASHKTSHIDEISFTKTLGDFSKSPKSHAAVDCALCFTSNIFTFAYLIIAAFFVAQIYLFLIWRDFDSVKLSYLYSTNTSRAPPFIS